MAFLYLRGPQLRLRDRDCKGHIRLPRPASNSLAVLGYRDRDLQEHRSLLSFPLCLPRACVGTVIMSSVMKKWGKGPI
eukprot:COSAG06_NODE_10733_length_1628_cov_1.230870_1_plen_78_part_00